MNRLKKDSFMVAHFVLDENDCLYIEDRFTLKSDIECICLIDYTIAVGTSGPSWGPQSDEVLERKIQLRFC